MNSALRENVFGSLFKLGHEFALLGWWFRNLTYLLRAKKISEFEYVEKASKLAQSNLFASHYISLFGLCSKEKFCSSECSDVRMIYDLILDGDSRNLIHDFKALNLKNSFVYFCCTFNVVFLVCIRKQDRQVMEFVPRTRRIQGLDKQVDYGPKELLKREWYHKGASVGRLQQSYQFGDWIWDPIWQPTLQGEHISDHSSNVFNLFSRIAGDLDLRSNPFKGGGDGVILERPNEDAKQPGVGEDLDQMELAQNKEKMGLRGLESLERPINGMWTSGKEILHKHEDKAHQSSLDQPAQKGKKLDHEWSWIRPAQEENEPAHQLVPEEAQSAHKSAQESENLDQKENGFKPAQDEDLSNLGKGPIIRSKAKTQRKPILQVAWAWLRRKRKKPRRLKQLGLFNCF